MKIEEINNDNKKLGYSNQMSKSSIIGKPHIGIFGRRNNGKSSFINTLTGQDVAIVSDHAGTTTDPVKKSIEIFGIGPAIVIDTAGIDDTGELGLKRVQKTMNVINLIDCAILIIASNVFDEIEIEWINKLREAAVPFLLVHNKSDLKRLNADTEKKIRQYYNGDIIEFTTYTPDNLEVLISKLKNIIPENAYKQKRLLADLINPGEFVVLVTPIDKEAPEGRMILPQQMAIRDVLDQHAICIVLQESELKQFFQNTSIQPALVVTDSQVFEKVSKIVPENIPLTSFSIIFARLKGEFDEYLKDTPKIDQLKDGDKVLILESCTHQVNCDDIGRHKLPEWIKKYTGKSLSFEIIAGLASIPHDIHQYSLVIQCGGCMVTPRQLSARIKPFIDNGIPVTNYGMAIAWMNGIFDRVTALFRK